MNITVNGLKIREDGDPDYADFWLEILHMATGISWEIPLTTAELERLKPYIPKWAMRPNGGGK